MKKLSVLLLILFVAGLTKAQTYVFESLDKSVANGFWDMANLYSNQGDSKAKWDVTDVTTDKKEGSGALQLDYLCGAGDGWGGYIVRTSIKPLPNGQVYDLSTGTKLSFWYKVTKPAVMTKPGAMVFEFKICDIVDGKENRVFREMPIDLTDASGTWKKVEVDFTMGTDKTISWAYQAQDGDREMAWDHVNGFEWAVVYVPKDGGSATNTPTASGTVLIDGFSVTGDHYAPPLLTFAKQASAFTTTWSSGTGGFTLKDEATDIVEGTTGSLKADYTCDASEDWGGVTGFEIPVTAPAKFVERTALTLFVKNAKACVTTVPKRAVLRIYMFEGNDGEQWVTKVPIDLTKVSDWTRYRLPLKQGVNGGYDGNTNSDQYPPVGTWARNPNGPKTDDVFNQEKVSKIKIEVLAIGAGGADKGPKGEKLVGTLLFSMLQNSGFQVYDITPPAAPAGVSVVKGTYSNLISWKDVSNEGTEKYNVYASKTAFTNVNAAGVEVVASNIARGTQVLEHLIRTPKTDKDVTYYYAVNAIDKAGNVGAVAFTAAVTNKAKGIPTISMVAPPNWKADGALTEWTGYTPWKLKPSDGSAHIMTGFTVTNDADCSADVYVAISGGYLYCAFNVTDDIVYADDDKYMSSGYNWALDACDLEFGLYNQQAKQHTAYQRGKYPDYHLRFNKVRAREDHWTAEKDSLLLPGVNYYWKEKFPTGYVVEAKVSLSDLANLRKSSTAVKDTIPTLKEGFKIPFDICVMDNDGKNGADLGANREGQISWSPFNNDNGWSDPSKLMYTWLGETDVVGIQDKSVPYTYELSQNYPNPFNPTTQIRYSVAQMGTVSLRIFDVLGRQVAELVNKQQDAGNYTVNFDASRYASGVYFYRLESGSFTSVKKMLLVK